MRTPMMVRWPQKIASNQLSNEIVSIHNSFPTLASIADGSVPDDRAIAGVVQSILLLGENDKPARDSVLFFHDDTLLAIK